MVGVTGVEPAYTWSQTMRATVTPHPVPFHSLLSSLFKINLALRRNFCLSLSFTGPQCGQFHPPGGHPANFATDLRNLSILLQPYQLRPELICPMPFQIIHLVPEISHLISYFVLFFLHLLDLLPQVYITANLALRHGYLLNGGPRWNRTIPLSLSSSRTSRYTIGPSNTKMVGPAGFAPTTSCL